MISKPTLRAELGISVKLDPVSSLMLGGFDTTSLQGGAG